MILQLIINVFISMWLIDLYIVKKSPKLKYYKVNRFYFENFKFLENFLIKFGCVLQKDILVYSIILVTIPVISIFVSISNSIISGLTILVLVYLIVIIVISLKKNALEVSFRKNAYKLYKYMSNQIDAGVLPKDALLSIHEVVEDKLLKEILYKACGAYQFTMNPLDASLYITKYIKSQEASSFAIYIKDIAFEGQNKEITDRLEQHMFNRYFAYIQRKTERVKIKSMITTITFCAIIVIMIMVPMYMDVQKALNSIFL